MIENVEDIRLWFFLIFLFLFLTLENIKPFRFRKLKNLIHYSNNLALSVANTLVIKILVPLSTVGVAVMAYEKSWGVFNFLEWPKWLEIFLAWLLLDGLIYFQHRFFHYIPVLWRLHRVHHTDIDFDVTTGLRFHPIEIVISLLIKMTIIIIIGAPVLAVIIFEIVLNVCAMFTHSNFRLPDRLENRVRKILVTPSLHRIHHSVIREECDSNYGNCLILWDKLFSSFRQRASVDEEKIEIGQRRFSNEHEQGVLQLLMQPFKY